MVGWTVCSNLTGSSGNVLVANSGPVKGKAAFAEATNP